MTFTKEQLAKIIESADEVISACDGTNEDVHPESDDMLRLWDHLNDVAAPPQVVKRLAEIALASLESRADAEPVAYMIGGHYLMHAKDPKVDNYTSAVPLYTRPQPAPVVPLYTLRAGRLSMRIIMQSAGTPAAPPCFREVNHD